MGPSSGRLKLSSCASHSSNKTPSRLEKARGFVVAPNGTVLQELDPPPAHDHYHQGIYASMLPWARSKSKEMMSSLGSGIAGRYPSNMTNWTTLQYVASVASMLPILALAERLVSSQSFAAATRRQLGSTGAVIIMLPAWMLGKLIGLGAMVAAGLIYLPSLLAELWLPKKIAAVARKWHKALLEYCGKRAFYRARHLRTVEL